MPQVLELEGRRYHASCVSTDDKKNATTVAPGAFDDDEMCASCEDPLGDIADDGDDDEDEEEED